MLTRVSERRDEIKTFLHDANNTWFPEACWSGCWNTVSIINTWNLLFQGQNTPNFHAESKTPDFSKLANYAANGSVARLWFLPGIWWFSLLIREWDWLYYCGCIKNTANATRKHEQIFSGDWSSPRIHSLPASKHSGWLKHPPLQLVNIISVSIWQLTEH